MKLTGKSINRKLTSLTKTQLVRNEKKVPHIWILAADNHLARIYIKINNQMELIGEAEPEEHFIEAEINNKITGWTAGAEGSMAHHKFEPHSKGSRQQTLSFAREISYFLGQVEIIDVFDKLVVISPPEMLHALRSSFSQFLNDRIIVEIDKDLNKLDDKEFEKIVWF
jgi:protein required for attachment to host cells